VDEPRRPSFRDVVARLETLHAAAAAAADNAGVASCFEDPLEHAAAPATPDGAPRAAPAADGDGSKGSGGGSSEAPAAGAYVLTTPFAAASGLDDGSNRNGLTGWF
jgi:hypothetical protein